MTGLRGQSIRSSIGKHSSSLLIFPSVEKEADRSGKSQQTSAQTTPRDHKYHFLLQLDTPYNPKGRQLFRAILLRSRPASRGPAANDHAPTPHKK
jgi:hypothetical protein